MIKILTVKMIASSNFLKLYKGTCKNTLTSTAHKQQLKEGWFPLALLKQYAGRY